MLGHFLGLHENIYQKYRLENNLQYKDKLGATRLVGIDWKPHPHYEELFINVPLQLLKKCIAGTFQKPEIMEEIK
jgi:hypothetical protein